MLNTKGALEGTTVITSHQTNGKGQRGNSWESEAGKNITFTIVIKPKFVTAPFQFHLHIITTLAIHQVLFPILGKGLKIKWPNDIYYKDKKLGGILIENSLRGAVIETSIIGIGINVNQIEFVNTKATSLLELTGKSHEPNDLIEQIIIQIENKYLSLKSNGIKDLEQAYIRRLYRYNEFNLYSAGGKAYEGRIVGITPHGKLMIEQTKDGMIYLETYAFKEVTFL